MTEDSLFKLDNSWAAAARTEDAVTEPSTAKKKRIRAAMYEFSPEYLYRRAYSEVGLLDLFGTFDFREGACYNILTNGDVDGLSYLKAVLRSQRLDHCILSTWCMFAGDALQLLTWLESGEIGRLDL